MDPGRTRKAAIANLLIAYAFRPCVWGMAGSATSPLGFQLTGAAAAES